MSGTTQYFKASEVVDRALRDKLNVSDVNDVRAIVPALKKRYPALVQRLELETQGFAVSSTAPPTTPSKPTSELPNEARARQSREDVASELTGLIAHPAVRLERAELQAWQQSILNCVDETFDAARRATDASYFDVTVIGIQRLRGHAFEARSRGYRTPAIWHDYRRLAATIDRCVMSIRVLVGDALREASTNRALTPVARSSELNAMRDAVLQGLRCFQGNEDDCAGLATASQTMATFRGTIQTGKTPELLAYLSEGVLNPILNRLILEAASGGGQLSSAMQFELTQLGKVQRGYGYMRLATPLQLVDSQDAITPQLTKWIVERATFASRVEKDLACCTDYDNAPNFDKLLRRLDEVIDFIASASPGAPNLRVQAMSLLTAPL